MQPIENNRRQITNVLSKFDKFYWEHESVSSRVHNFKNITNLNVCWRILCWHWNVPKMSSKRKSRSALYFMSPLRQDVATICIWILRKWNSQQSQTTFSHLPTLTLIACRIPSQSFVPSTLSHATIRYRISSCGDSFWTKFLIRRSVVRRSVVKFKTVSHLRNQHITFERKISSKLLYRLRWSEFGVFWSSRYSLWVIFKMGSW